MRYLDKQLQGCSGLQPRGCGMEAGPLQKTVHLGQSEHESRQLTQLNLHVAAWKRCRARRKENEKMRNILLQ